MFCLMSATSEFLFIFNKENVVQCYVEIVGIFDITLMPVHKFRLKY